MNTMHKLIYRFGHVWSISASLGLWLLLLGALPDALVSTTYAWIDKGLTGASKVLMASSDPAEPEPLCAEIQQSLTSTSCFRNSL